MTTYLVFRKGTEDDLWTQVAVKDARSAMSAIRQHLDGGKEGGTLAAVPARSWNPVTVKVETKTELKFS